MRQNEYQQWLKSLQSKELVCIQQPITSEEKPIYRFEGKWRYVAAKIVDTGVVVHQSFDVVNFYHYNPSTGEILDALSKTPISDYYLVPAFDDMDLNSTDVIS